VRDAIPGCGALLLACLYLAAVRRLGHRGISWSAWRTLAGIGGIASIALALAPPVAGHDEDIRVHMIQHLWLGMLAPLLLALTAPVTLLLRVLPPSRRPAVARLLRARAAHVLIHPAITAPAASGSLIVLYWTPLYAATLRSDALHAAVHAHMLATGFLFASSVVGRDPVRKRPSRALRSAGVIGASAAHGIIAKLLYANAGSLAGDGGTADQWRQAAQILFYGGDAVGLFVLVAFFHEWYARPGRTVPGRGDAAARARPRMF
jgi:cytochrome c oxidase assembly factor CtaG